MGNCFAHESRRQAKRSFHMERTTRMRVKGGVARANKSEAEGEEEERNKDSVRVSVVMTKKEAAQLLSMLGNSKVDTLICKVGGIQLGSGASPNGGRDCWIPVLQSIPENGSY